MANDNSVLDVLRRELEFIEKGGYRHTARASWRPHFMFQDSPTCLNCDPLRPRKPCRDCSLMPFIPEGFRSREAPCRFIPLNDRGETIDSLYRTGAQEELESAVATWLKNTIAALAYMRPAEHPNDRLEIHVKARVVARPKGE